MRIRDWSSDVCSSDLAARIWPAPVSKSSNLSPDRSSVALRLSEIVRIAMRTGLNGRLSSIGMAEAARVGQPDANRSEEHTSELQSLMRNSYAVFCLKKKTNTKTIRSK